MTWNVRQLTEWYAGLEEFDREMYAYFLDAIKHRDGVPQEQQSVSSASEAAACTIQNRRMRAAMNTQQLPCAAGQETPLPHVARPTTEGTESGPFTDTQEVK